MTSEDIERVLMAYLTEPPTVSGDGVPIPPLYPIRYLLASYARATYEGRSLSTMKDTALAERAYDLLQYAKSLCVSYVGMTLTMDMFPQPEDAQQRGTLQLLDALDGTLSAAGAAAGSPLMPPGFLEDLANRFVEEGLSEMIIPAIQELGRRVLGKSPLSLEIGTPLQILGALMAVKNIAKVVCEVRRTESGTEAQEKWL